MKNSKIQPGGNSDSQRCPGSAQRTRDFPRLPAAFGFDLGAMTAGPG